MLDAVEIGECGIGAIRDRAATRDNESGERSMARTVRIFAAMTGLVLSETDGWKFMLAVKLGRASQGKHNADDYIDLVGYAALAGEAAERSAHA